MEVNELEDAKTLKAVMFLMIQEHVKSIPNDQELGARIRKIINKFNEMTIKIVKYMRSELFQPMTNEDLK